MIHGYRERASPMRACRESMRWLSAAMIALSSIAVLESCSSKPESVVDAMHLEVAEVLEGPSEEAVQKDFRRRDGTVERLYLGPALPLQVVQAVARATSDSEWGVIFSLWGPDRIAFAEWTRSRVKKTMAVLVEGAIKSTGVIAEPLPGGGMIGHLTQEEASHIAGGLMAGRSEAAIKAAGSITTRKN